MSDRSRRRWRNLSVPRRILRVVLCILLALVLVVAAYVAYVFLDTTGFRTIPRWRSAT